jgi:hypothetical protein
MVAIKSTHKTLPFICARYPSIEQVSNVGEDNKHKQKKIPLLACLMNCFISIS